MRTIAVGDVVHLAGEGVGVALEVVPSGLVVRHLGAPLDERDVAVLRELQEQPLGHAELDEVVPALLVPEHGSGWPGAPGLEGARDDGTGWAPRCRVVTAHADDGRVVVEARDDAAGLTVTSRVAVEATTGAVLLTATVRNDAEDPYRLARLATTVPLPRRATEVLRFTGRWSSELREHREPWHDGAVVVENRRGRSSHQAPPLVLAGTAGFGASSGEAWAAHLAWSGNHRLHMEVLTDGRRCLQMGELLLPGEVVLGPGEEHTTPEVVLAWSDRGTNGCSHVLHAEARRRMPTTSRPRPVIVNTWEAAYFDLDVDRLMGLAERAARVGAERFVLDDGWFGSRRDDTAGLGDWWVAPDVFPDGLGPLIAHVRRLGLEFGIWVEPEMANADSDLLRAHPDWVLAGAGLPPVTGRGQLVVDLTRDDAWRHVHDQLDRLLADHDIAYVKWDHNRELWDATSRGRAAARAQVTATLRLLASLRSRHPGVEFESCASGGGRIDFGILPHVERFWVSDSNDALERQRIQRGFSHLLPPEVMGAHVGPPTAHTTGRTQRLSLRAGTALFGHLGIEWDLLGLDDEELSLVAEVVALHKRFRPLLHGGDTHRIDHPDDGVVAHAVVAPDGAEALVSLVVTGIGPHPSPAPLRLVGLDDAVDYRVETVPLPDEGPSVARHQPAWPRDGVVASGRVLRTVGLQPPILPPEGLLLVHVVATQPGGHVTASVSRGRGPSAPPQHPA